MFSREFHIAVYVNLVIFVCSTNKVCMRMLKIQIPMLCGRTFVLYACFVHGWRFKFCKIDAITVLIGCAILPISLPFEHYCQFRFRLNIACIAWQNAQNAQNDSC